MAKTKYKPVIEPIHLTESVRITDHNRENWAVETLSSDGNWRPVAFVGTTANLKRIAERWVGGLAADLARKNAVAQLRRAPAYTEIDKLPAKPTGKSDDT